MLHKVMLGFWHRENKLKQKTDPDSLIFHPDRIRIALTCGWRRIQSILVKCVVLPVSYVGIHRHKKTDPESIIVCPYRIRIKLTSGWKRIQIHLVEYVCSLCSKVCWVYRHKMDSESLIFCPGRIRIIHLFLNRIRDKIKPAAGGGSSLF